MYASNYNHYLRAWMFFIHTDRAIRHRACALRDTANALIDTQLDQDFAKLCEEVAESRRRRGISKYKHFRDIFRFIFCVLKSLDLDTTYLDGITVKDPYIITSVEICSNIL